jgi:hypothetical protein
MSYIDKILVDGEQILHRAQKSRSAVLVTITLPALIILAIFRVPIPAMIGAALVLTAAQLRAPILALTDRRIIGKVGTKIIDLKLDQTIDMEVGSKNFLIGGILGRFIHSGTVKIKNEKGTATFYFIDHPDEFRRVCLEAARLSSSSTPA